ncbi:MAG TPA: molecular chaperone DnaJ [bacterium]|nr:molecular chaperone DnaJ [bacterium]
MNKDYYKVLGVGEDASDAAVKLAYRKLAKKYHPDKNKGDSQAETRFKEIGEAFAVLSDAKKRQQYDTMRKYGCSAGPGGTRGGAQGMPFDFSQMGDFGDIFGSGGFSFDDLFGAQRDTREDRLEQLEIPFGIAAHGGAVQVNVSQEEDCRACHGTGARDGVGVSTCPQCHGSGMKSAPAGGFAFNRPCPLCCGRGSIIEQPCPVCHGGGTVNGERTVTVNVPAGTTDGQKIRIPGAGRGRKRAGDLYLQVKVQEDRFFRMDGYDVHCTVPINFAQAALGSHIRVRTLDGFVKLAIPPGTQSGTRFRVRGKGVARRNGTRGNQYISVQVTVPQRMTDEQQQALAQYARLAGMRH